jgi:hypothetical protein
MTLYSQITYYLSAHYLSLLCFQNPTKARQFIGLLNTLGLSLLSSYSLVLVYNNGLRSVPSLMALPEHTELNDSIVAHFTTDLAVGHFLDRPNMELVTGYVHHAVYAAILTYLRQTQQSNLIYLCLPFEIPTVLMNLNRFDEAKRFTLPFGTTFLLFRVLYNLYVIAAVSNNPLHVCVATAMLAMHTHWFQLWFRKYVNRNR